MTPSAGLTADVSTQIALFVVFFLATIAIGGTALFLGAICLVKWEHRTKKR